MARISGVDLPREKRVEIGLTYIYGIGRASAARILAEAEVNPDTRVKDLTDDEVKKLAAIIADSQVVEGDLRREIAMNIKRLQEIGCYRGIRHRKSLPVREVRTSISLTACSYASHFSRLRQSSSVIFHCFAGASMRSLKRRSCSSLSI